LTAGEESDMNLSRVIVWWALAVAIALPFSTRAAMAKRPLMPSIVVSSPSGRELFRSYCSTCHGREGKGDGPVAQSLKRPPPDLTTIARRNGGDFPFEAIVLLVSGEDPPVGAHGSREMPVWGPFFRSVELDDRPTRIRVENVVRFVESIQALK
jgi:mono/diheme cytochrome c family protein